MNVKKFAVYFLVACLPISAWTAPKSKIICQSQGRALSVSLPKSFKLDYKSSDSGQTLEEYVPKCESVHDWTEIITIISRPVNRGQTPKGYIDYVFPRSLELPAVDTKILHSPAFETKKGVPRGSFMLDRLSLKVDNGHFYHLESIREIYGESIYLMGGKLWLIQYTHRYDNFKTTKSDAQKKVETFFQSKIGVK